jgi:hypothetical protein
MARKKKAKGHAPQPPREDPRALCLPRKDTETLADAVAHLSLRPTVQAARTLMEFNKSFGEMSINTLIADLRKQCNLASEGDLTRAEALLTAQAHTLDALFNNLARRAAFNMGQSLDVVEAYLRLALKAQGQCRATLETLAAIKNPQPVAFVRQANIAHGPQQVNNGPFQLEEPSRARETENPQNKLLETGDGEQLELKTAGAASEADSSLEALGAVHRPKDSSQ